MNVKRSPLVQLEEKRTVNGDKRERERERDVSEESKKKGLKGEGISLYNLTSPSILTPPQWPF